MSFIKKIEISNMSRFHYINKTDVNSLHGPRPGYEVQPQRHSCCEIVFYDTGCDGITVIDGTEYKFKAGDIALMRSNVVHSEKHYSEGTLYFFGFDYLGEYPDTFPESGLYSNIWGAKTIIYSMLKEQITQDIDYKDMLSLKVEELLLLIRRHESLQKKPVKNSAKNLNFVKYYIQENYMQNISVESLAKMTGYSVAHFRSLFTEAFGISPKNYLIDVRCKIAYDLLMSTSLSCTEIAYHTGFSNSGQMSSMLKKKYNKKPLEIRKSNIEK